MTSPVETPRSTAAEQQSLGELIGEVTKDLSTLMRQEVDLAKAELTQSARRAGKGTGMLGGAAFAGYMVLLFLTIALWWAIGSATGLGWSAVIVAVIWGVIGATLAALAYAFSPFHVAQAAYHAHIAQTQWVPLFFFALWRSLDAPTARAVCGLAGAALTVSLSNFYGGFIAAVLTPGATAAQIVAEVAAVLAARDQDT